MAERTLLKILGPKLVVFFLLVMQTTPAIAQTPSKEQARETQDGESGGTAETKSLSPGPYSGDFWRRSASANFLICAALAAFIAITAISWTNTIGRP